MVLTIIITSLEVTLSFQMHMNLVCILYFMSNKTSTAFSNTSVNFQECVFSVTSNFTFWFTLNVIYLFVILLAAFFMIYSNRNIFHVLKFSHVPRTESICRYSRLYWKFRVNREREGTWQYYTVVHVKRRCPVLWSSLLTTPPFASTAKNL